MWRFPPLKDLNSSQANLTNITYGSGPNQDVTLAIGEGEETQEFFSIPLVELERRCRKNGLYIHGGREVMVSQFLSLEEVEKQKNQDQDEEVRYEYNSTIGGKNARETNANLKLGGGRWSTGEERKSILDKDKEYMSRYRKNVQEESSLW